MDSLELKAILEEKKHATELSRARKHDVRMSFYSERYLQEKDNSYGMDFFKKVRNKLSNIRSIDSFNLNIDFPLEINNFTNEIQKKLSEIWNGQNANYKANFKKEVENVGINTDFYRNKVFDRYFKTPNTLILLLHNGTEVDYEFIEVENVLEYSKIGNKFKFVIFKYSDVIYYIDGKEYIEFNIIGSDYNTLDETNRVTLENLTECPVYHISTELYNTKSNFVRTNIYANSISYFDLLQEVIIYKKMLTPFAFNLIVEKYRNPDCKYENNGVYCENGLLYSDNENNEPTALIRNNAHVNCPVCNSKTSPGMVVEKTTAFNFDKTDVISDVIKFISPDTDILEYSDTFINLLKEQILNSIIGKTKEQNNNQNSNEVAIHSNNMDRITVILDLKSKFENIIKSVENAKFTWLYGDSFDFWSINLGTNFLLKSLDDLYKELKFAKEFNPIEVKNIQNQIISTKYATDLIMKKRALILMAFVPDVDIQNPLVPTILKQKKILFNDFINWFEKKNNNIGLIYEKQENILTQMDKEFTEYLETFKINEE